MRNIVRQSRSLGAVRRGGKPLLLGVYLDFGDDILYRLETYDETGMNSVRLVAKRKFIHDVMVETRVENIATRFYPIQT